MSSQSYKSDIDIINEAYGIDKYTVDDLVSDVVEFVEQYMLWKNIPSKHWTFNINLGSDIQLKLDINIDKHNIDVKYDETLNDLNIDKDQVFKQVKDILKYSIMSDEDNESYDQNLISNSDLMVTTMN